MRYRYLGEVQRPGIIPGPMKEIKLPKKDGSWDVLTPIPPATSFPVGQEIPYDIEDPRSIYAMNADPRFEAII